MRIVNLFMPVMHHCEDATARLLRALGIRFTQSYLQNELVTHPDYPSLNAIADVIGISYNVACAPVRITIEGFRASPDFRLPFLAQVKGMGINHDVFAVVTDIKENTIEWYNPAAQKQQQEPLESFNKLYKGLMLIVEAGGQKTEPGYSSNLENERRRAFLQSVALWALPVLSIAMCMLYLVSKPLSTALAPVAFTFLALVSTLVSSLLLLHEVDQYNPVVKQVCKAAATVNCAAVLNSKASKIMGISWSSLGFVYFTGMLLSLLTTGISEDVLSLSAWLSLPALSYTVFSIYYQWKVVKQWCRLCLMVQVLLVLLFATALAGGFYNAGALQSISIYSVVAYASSFLFTLTAILIVMPALQNAKSNRQKTIELQRMKHNPQIFEGVLAKQKEIERPAADIGITMGNENAVYKIIKVCNPYCGPCAKAHPTIDELVAENEEVSAQIIFTATEHENDQRREPVAHLLAIAMQGNEVRTQQALDDWYLADKKDYDVFAAKHPINEELKMQTQKIIKMRQWCEKVQIAATPTFFISLNNNDSNSAFYQLPEMYTVADLKYFFTN